LAPENQAVFMSCKSQTLYAKLADMGLIEGSVWEVIKKMPFHGPLILGNGSCRISIREEDADLVWMETLKP
jgi:Fe2+ transport system protein FeoA